MRNHLEPPEPIILKLKRASEDALAAASIEELLGIEGAAASQYFQQFSGIVKIADEFADSAESPHPACGHPIRSDGRGAGGEGRLAFNFNFANRNCRPPTDPCLGSGSKVERGCRFLMNGEFLLLGKMQ
jgi:CRISPR-associated protein Cas1